MKPTFTLTYGLGWNLEMPPYELNGNQVALVDANGQPVIAADFPDPAGSRALQGRPILPNSATVWSAGVGAGLKYPYNPYYGEFSPRVSLAWNPRYSDGIWASCSATAKP